jgi:hypothetical protein
MVTSGRSDRPIATPGWYPDPSGAPTQRYFDGTKWTDQLAPLSTPMVAYTPVQGPLPAPKSAVAAGLLQLFLGTFGAGRFYIGTTGTAAAQLVLGLVGPLLHAVLLHRHADPDTALDLDIHRRNHDVYGFRHRLLWAQVAVIQRCGATARLSTANCGCWPPFAGCVVS